MENHLLPPRESYMGPRPSAILLYTDKERISYATLDALPTMPVTHLTDTRRRTYPATQSVILIKDSSYGFNS